MSEIHYTVIQSKSAAKLHFYFEIQAFTSLQLTTATYEHS